MGKKNKINKNNNYLVFFICTSLDFHVIYICPGLAEIRSRNLRKKEAQKNKLQTLSSLAKVKNVYFI